MYTRQEDVDRTERELGTPRLEAVEFEIHPWEYDVVEGSMRGGRAHDVTMFIRGLRDSGNIVVIKKPFFPPGAYRAPSGGAVPLEPLANAAVRESLEETGLEVSLERYLARMKARFTSEDRVVIEWTSHIFEAREVEGTIGPLDTGEIEEARWATIDEIQGAIRKSLLNSGWGLFKYRVALTDLTLEEMERRT
jgi:8-oxo-dGTP pyrophosphatase MutT (NUDIX family)